MATKLTAKAPTKGRPRSAISGKYVPKTTLVHQLSSSHSHD